MAPSPVPSVLSSAATSQSLAGCPKTPSSPFVLTSIQAYDTFASSRQTYTVFIFYSSFLSWWHQLIFRFLCTIDILFHSFVYDWFQTIQKFMTRISVALTSSRYLQTISSTRTFAAHEIFWYERFRSSASTCPYVPRSSFYRSSSFRYLSHTLLSILGPFKLQDLVLWCLLKFRIATQAK